MRGLRKPGFYRSVESPLLQVIVQPSGFFLAPGFAAAFPFVQGLLNKLKIEPLFKGREEYKNAVNMFTETTFTPPHREATEAILDSLTQQVVRYVHA